MTKQYSNKNNYFFTSDTEFNHKNIIKYCNRPFKDVSHMNEVIVANWNSVVGKSDTVFHLGDVGRNCDDLVKRLNGNIVYIQGNHDNFKAPAILDIRIDGLLDEYGNQRYITLCHYPMRSWNKSHYASWHLFGHTHGKAEPYGLSFDVGMDCWDYTPVSLNTIGRAMKKLKPIEDFRR